MQKTVLVGHATLKEGPKAGKSITFKIFENTPKSAVQTFANKVLIGFVMPEIGAPQKKLQELRDVNVTSKTPCTDAVKTTLGDAWYVEGPSITYGIIGAHIQGTPVHTITEGLARLKL
jgi:hypothetical protein